MDKNTLFEKEIKNYKNNEKWENSRFEGIKTLSNTHIGEIGQNYIYKLCKDLKLKAEPSKTKGSWDIKIEGIKFEIKTATEDTNKNFQFNHIRYHREYDGVICLGVAPNFLYFNIWTKAELSTKKAGTLVSMEKQANASYKLTKKATELHPIDCFDDKIRQFICNFE